MALALVAALALVQMLALGLAREVMLGAPMPVTAASSLPRFEVQDLREVIGGERFFDRPTLSPDGSTLAWGNDVGGLCLYHIASGERHCVAWPPNLTVTLNGSEWIPHWSPDSRQIAFTEGEAIEKDIWIFDVETETFTDLTDDRMTAANPKPTVGIDVLPTWSPDGSMIYFLRLVPLPTNSFRAFDTTLYRISPHGGQAEWVRTLMGDMLGPSIFIYGMSVAPDGNTIALFRRDDQRSNDARDGLWLLDVPHKLVVPVVGFDELKAGLPAWYGSQYVAVWNVRLVWIAEGAEVLVEEDFSAGPVMMNVAHVDVLESRGTPLFDFSGLSETSNYQDPVWQESPQQGTLTADGKWFFYVTQGDTRTIWALPLLSGGERLMVGRSEDSWCGSRLLLVTVDDTDHYLLNFGYCPT
jgi:hypothetical protein